MFLKKYKLNFTCLPVVSKRRATGTSKRTHRQDRRRWLFLTSVLQKNQHSAYSRTPKKLSAQIMRLSALHMLRKEQRSKITYWPAQRYALLLWTVRLLLVREFTPLLLPERHAFQNHTLGQHNSVIWFSVKENSKRDWRLFFLAVLHDFCVKRASDVSTLLLQTCMKYKGSVPSLDF